MCVFVLRVGVVFSLLFLKIKIRCVSPHLVVYRGKALNTKKSNKERVCVLCVYLLALVMRRCVLLLLGKVK